MSLWQQIASATNNGIATQLNVLGVLTKYSIVPDLITEDELESTMLLASSSSSSASTDVIQFPTFLYLLELVAESLNESNLSQYIQAKTTLSGATDTSRKLHCLLCILGMNIFQRRAFKFMMADQDLGPAAEAGTGARDDSCGVFVFDEDELQQGRISFPAVLWWLRQAGAITIPHTHIPALLRHLDSSSAVGGDPSSANSLPTGSLENVLFSSVNLTAGGSGNLQLQAGGAMSTGECVSILMKRLPALFFSTPGLLPLPRAPGAVCGELAALRCLYSSYTAPLLADSAVELEDAMTAMWVALRALESPEATSDEAQKRSFMEHFATASVRIHTVSDLFVEKELCPVVLSHVLFADICGTVMCEPSAAFTDESIILQAQLFEVLYIIAHDYWSVLEKLRRKRPQGTASGLRLSARQPQRAQQIFQTFLFLVRMLGTTTSTASSSSSSSSGAMTAVEPPPSVQATMELAWKQQQQPPPELSTPTPVIARIPVPVVAATRRPLPALETADLNDVADPPTSTPLTASIKQLSVSFNSRKRLDGSPAPTLQQLDESSCLFANHPLRDIAVLLLHFPISTFTLNPWSVMQLLRGQQQQACVGGGTVSAGPSRQGIADETASGSDRHLTDLLRKFCLQFGVSSEHLSEYFAVYYLPVDAKMEQAANESTKASTVLFKEQALRSDVLDQLMGEQALRILMLNADLLKWQYARCVALYRVCSDPFTSTTSAPLPSSETMAGQPVTSLLPASSALEWAVDCACIDANLAKLHLSQISCLTGNAVPALTFSSFIVFAVRCFAEGAGSTTTEAQFVESIRKMLQVFSVSLSSVQQSLRMKLLRPLFGKSEDFVKESLSDADVNALITISVGVFSAQSSIASSTALPPGNKAAPGDGRIPPRPPSSLWDAPRFVQMCRDLGLLCNRRWSAALCWDAYGMCLREDCAPGVDMWEEAVVPPVPVKASADLARKLVETALLVFLSQQRGRSYDRSAVDAELVSLYYKALVPMLSASRDPRRLAMTEKHPKVIDSGLRFEDLLRYGGSAMMESLSLARRFLQLTYYDLVTKALPTLMDLTGRSLSSVAIAGENAEKQQQVGEAPLNSICRLLSCHDLVRYSAVALQAKRSLQCRLRPVLFDRLSAGATPAGPSRLTELVTLSYEEFEELCVRVAFELWETSTAHLHAENFANKVALLSQAHFAGKPIEPLTAKAVDLYVAACIESERKRRGRLKSDKLSSWGVDFFHPFESTLEALLLVSSEVRANFENVMLGERKSLSAAGVGDEALIAVAKKPKGSVRFDENKNQVNVLNTGPGDDEAALSTIMDKRLQYSVADPAVRRGEPQPQRGAKQSNTHDVALAHRRNININSPLSFQAVIPGSPQQPREGKEWERGSRESSPSPKLHTSQQVIMSSTERFLLRQESSEQFVVALDALLVGTKEALWPVYATYCSCGDSLDPGKLSGPNLFTLLSKLGVLTDHTLLSDVGILLHQTALHSLSSSPVDALAALYEGGDYYDTPSLTFEEFIVFLCAFSQLRFEGVMLTADMFRKRLTSTQSNYTPSKVPQNPSSRHSQLSMPSPTPENWFKQWQEFMGSSASFRRLLVECVLPILRKQTLLAFPEDARLRDRFCCVFSLEVLLAVEGVEGPLQAFFEQERVRELQERQSVGGGSTTGLLPPIPSVGADRALSSPSAGAKYDIEITAIITALKRINLVPKVMGESQVLQLIKDVLPEETTKRRSGTPSTITANTGTTGAGVQPGAAAAQKNYLLFPQWEWVLSVVAFQAVETAMEQSPTSNDNEVCPMFPQLLGYYVTYFMFFFFHFIIYDRKYRLWLQML